MRLAKKLLWLTSEAIPFCINWNIASCSLAASIASYSLISFKVVMLYPQLNNNSNPKADNLWTRAIANCTLSENEKIRAKVVYKLFKQASWQVLVLHSWLYNSWYLYYWIISSNCRNIMTLDEEVVAIFGVHDLYQVLQVPLDASREEIKKAYLKRSLELHPDKISDPKQREESKCKFQLLNKIYETLSDTEKRSRYDSQYGYSHTLISRANVNLNSTIYEDVSLANCDEHDTFYSYDCRCSGRYILKKENSRSGPTQASPTPSVFIVDCESCSSSIRISL